MHSQLADSVGRPPLWQYQLWLPIISHHCKKVITYPLRRKLLFIRPLLFRFFPCTPLSCRKNMGARWEVCENISLAYLFIPTSDSYFNTCSLSRRDRLLKSSRPSRVSTSNSSIVALGLIAPTAPIHNSTSIRSNDRNNRFFRCSMFDQMFAEGDEAMENLFLVDLYLSNCFKHHFFKEIN